MALIRHATTIAQAGCMEILSQRVVYRNVQLLLQKQTTQITEPLLMGSFADKSAQGQSMHSQVPGNVSVRVQQDFTPTPSY
jgi:hypothetical protein